MKNYQFKTKATLFILSSTLILMGTCLKAQLYDCTELNPMPTPNLSASACAIGDRIYITGGSIDGQEVGQDWGSQINFIYDVADDSWSTGKTMPTKRWMHGSAEVDGKLYVIGGGWNVTLDNNDMYDPESDTWEVKAPMPTSRGTVFVCAIEGKIYAIGGFTRNRALDINEMYDPVTDTWHDKAPMSTDRTGCSMTVVDNKIYALGGTIMATSGFTSMEMYDPETDTWTQKASMNQGRFGLVASTIQLGGKKYIVAMGGTRSNLIPSEGYIEIYDVANNSWTELSNMSTPSQWGMGCSVDDQVYYFGGEDMCCMTFPDEATIFDNAFKFDFSLFDIHEVDNNISTIRTSPNPFTTSTTLSYELQQPDKVSLSIYNQMGQIVCQTQENQQQGNQQLIWNAEKFAEGVYYYRLEAGDQVANGKMVKVR